MNPAKEWYHTVRSNWQEALADESFKRYFWGNFLCSFGLYMLIVQWLKYNSTRHGALINDPLYAILIPQDFSPLIFFFTYSATVLSILYLLQYPHLLHRGFTTFAGIFLVRAICIYLIPLSPWGDMVPLHDPFSNFMANEENIYNDLFFSGHVADIAFFFFIVQNKWLKKYLFLCMVCAGTLLVWQRVHYTLDVLAAPFFAYCCYWALIERDIIWHPVLGSISLEKSAHRPATD